jgi:hypothetical protein
VSSSTHKITGFNSRLAVVTLPPAKNRPNETYTRTLCFVIRWLIAQRRQETPLFFNCGAVKPISSQTHQG